MGEWLDYRPSDFLLFSSETYWRLFELHNTELWPIQPVVLVATTALAGAALSSSRWASLAIGLGFAATWVLVAQTFLATRYEAINWAIGYITPLFLAEAALLALLGWRLRFGRSGLGPKVGAALAILGLVYPVVGLIAGRPLVQSEVAGVTPDPTVLMTLGVLGLAQRNWCRLVLTIVPAAWLLVSAGTLLALSAPVGWILLAAFGGVLCTWLPGQDGGMNRRMRGRA